VSRAPAKPLKPVVYVLDDDDGMRNALATLIGTIGYDAVGFARPSEFLRDFDPQRPACLLLDVRMPEMSGLDVQRELNRRGAMIPVLLITGHGDVPMAVQAMKDGAFEFLQKPFRDQELIDGINRALRRDAENRQTQERNAEVNRRVATLTPREREVMDLVVDGRANKVIAIDLGLSERTVEIHRANVMEKMQAQSVAHLVKMHLMANREH
jgi:two-component system, LuxR family, response regulator FixJ